MTSNNNGLQPINWSTEASLAIHKLVHQNLMPVYYDTVAMAVNGADLPFTNDARAQVGQVMLIAILVHVAHHWADQVDGGDPDNHEAAFIDYIHELVESIRLTCGLRISEQDADRDRRQAEPREVSTRRVVTHVCELTERLHASIDALSDQQTSADLAARTLMAAMLESCNKRFHVVRDRTISQRWMESLAVALAPPR